MDESWRFRSIQANICPTCSISHFPFCPPPHSFIDRNLYNSGENLRRFPSEINPPFHRSLHDQSFLDHRMAPPMPPFPMPPARDPVPPASFHPSQRFLHEEFLERENFHKRMRVEDPVPSQPFNRHDSIPGRISLEDEWRLNLIRDHGQQNTAPIEGSWNPHRSIGIDHSFRSPGLGSNGRIGSILPQETEFSHHNHRLQPNTYEGYRNFPEFPRSQSTDRFVPHERKDIQIHMTGISKSGALNPKIGEQPYGRNGQFDSSWQPDRSEYYVAKSPEERSFHDSWPPVSYPISDYISRGPQEKYYAHDHQQTYPAESSSYSLPKPPQYPHSDSYHLMPNVVNHEKESSYHLPYTTKRHPLENKFELQNQSTEVMRTTFQLKPPVPLEIQKPFEPQTYPPAPEEFSTNNYSMATTMMGRVHTSEAHPPLPPQPLLPLPPEPSPSHFQVTSSVPTPPSMLSPVPASTSAPVLLPPNSQSTSEPRPLTQPNFYNEHPMHTSTGFANEGIPFIHHTPSKEHLEGRGQTFPSRHSLKEKPTVIDACHLFRQPHRASRPDHIVIILRGLPGSGKSYLAKALRDLEVETGGNAPRIHAMDDYFMMEVEKKVEDNEGSKSSSSSRGKKQITKKVVEYCYEPEMEEAYRSSLLKAFKKTLDEGNFTFVIVDDRNLRVADFAQFWAIAKRSGYEVYLLEATYKDPTGCAARNVHGFTVDDIQKMAEQWEEAPPLYLQLDIQSLFHGDNLNEHSIQEVDMDTDDAVCDEEETLKLQRREDFKMTEPKSLVHGLDGGSLKIGERWNAEEEELIGVKELGKSKWSKDVDEDIENSDGAEGNMSALSGLIQAYSKSEKSVHWGDQVDQSGFSIGAVKKQSRSSLVIGPGTGYNLDSNPLPEEEDAEVATGRSNINESKRRFTEQLKAERESFKAVFDRRRQRIGGLWDAGDD